MDSLGQRPLSDYRADTKSIAGDVAHTPQRYSLYPDILAALAARLAYAQYVLCVHSLALLLPGPA